MLHTKATTIAFWGWKAVALTTKVTNRPFQASGQGSWDTAGWKVSTSCEHHLPPAPAAQPLFWPWTRV